MNEEEKILQVFENTGDFGNYYLGDYSNIDIAKFIRKILKENQSLKDSRENAIEYINNHTIEWVDEKFKENNIMVKFDEYSNPQALLEILKGDKE